MKSLLLALIGLIPLFAQANSGRHYKMYCLVAAPNASGVLAHETITPSSGEEISLYKSGDLEWTAGATETLLPNGLRTTQMLLKITKKGEVISLTLADFDPRKASSAALWSSYDLPSLSCSSAAE